MAKPSGRKAPPTVRAAPAGLSVRRIDLAGREAFEVTIGAAQDQPPGNRPPTMRYLFFRDQLEQFAAGINAALAAPTAPPFSPPTH